MYKAIAGSLVAVALMITTAAFAQTVIDANGRVVRVDPSAQVIILDNNQALRVTPNTVLMVDNRPVTLQTLQPGQTVFIRSGESVTLSQGAPSTSGNTVVVNPAPSPSASPETTQQTVYGRVDDVGSGEVKIKTDTDNFKVKMPREVAAQLRKGDSVRMDLTFQPSR